MTNEKDDTRNFLLEVIDLYKQLPALWKIKSEEYSIRAKKEEAYTLLLSKYQERYKTATMEDLKKKLNTLRTNFRKELKKANDSVKPGSGTDEVYEPNVWYYNAMMFLSDQDMTSRTKSITELDETKDEIADRLDSKNIGPLVKVTKPATKTGKRKKVVKGEIRDELISLACERLQQPEDHNLNLAKTWAHELSLMCPQQQLLAKKAINDVLFEGQCGNLRRDSVQINIATNSSISSTPHGYLCHCSYSMGSLSPSQDMADRKQQEYSA